MPAPMVYSNAFAGPSCGCVRTVRESAENPPLAPRAIEPVWSPVVCACATLESTQQSATFPTATMMRSKIGMRYLGWPPAADGQTINRLELNDPVSHRVFHQFRKRAGVRLFDHLVGAAEDRLRNHEAERLRGFQVNEQLDFGGLLNRQVGRVLSLEDSAGVDAGQMICVVNAPTLTHQA